MPMPPISCLCGPNQPVIMAIIAQADVTRGLVGDVRAATGWHTLLRGCNPMGNGLARAACTPGPPCALPSPLLRRLSSPSQRHAAPCSAWLRGALARQPRRSGRHGRAVRTVGRPVGDAGAGAAAGVAPKDRLHFLSVNRSSGVGKGQFWYTLKRRAVRGFPSRRHAAIWAWNAASKGGTNC